VTGAGEGEGQRQGKRAWERTRSTGLWDCPLNPPT